MDGVWRARLGKLAEGHGARDWIAAAAGGFAALGVVVYLVIRNAYERFYRPLGITPEDVGPDSATILVQSAVGVFQLIL
jgi:hypothetical protein